MLYAYQYIELNRIPDKLMRRLKIFFFDLIFAFTTNHILNPKLTLLIDLLELLTLPCLYLNPIYSHLHSHSILHSYFSQIYPYFYHFRLDPS